MLKPVPCCISLLGYVSAQLTVIERQLSEVTPGSKGIPSGSSICIQTGGHASLASPRRSWKERLGVADT